MAEDVIKEVVKKGSRNEADIRVVQRLLNANISKITPLSALKVDGGIGEKTINAILEFQKRVVGMSEPDGRVDWTKVGDRTGINIGTVEIKA